MCANRLSAPASAAPAAVFAGFPAAVFEVFRQEDFDACMAALRREATPRLSALGQQLVPALSARLQAAAYAHVARHLRRRVHPPEDTWVAWSTTPRGYKAQVHFEVGVARRGGFVRLAALAEAGPAKAAFIGQLSPARLQALPPGPSPVLFTPDHHGAVKVPAAQLDADWVSLERQARRVQSGVALVIETPAEAVVRRGAQWADDVLAAIDRLLPLASLG